jgi:hypothetical protein
MEGVLIALSFTHVFKHRVLSWSDLQERYLDILKKRSAKK